LPVLGDFKLSSVLVFDIGVSLVVVGLVFMVFEAFGEEEAPEFRGEPIEPEPDTGIPDKDAIQKGAGA
jgi:multicomponent Na+:H+ antiporter subunit A